MVNDLISAIILAIIQGVTEWLPISSSGHLVLFQSFLGFEGGLLFEVALHFGTLAAVFVYFGKDIMDIIKDFFSGKWNTENGKIGWLLIIASVPAALIGFFSRNIYEKVLTNFGIVALGFGVTGLLLFIASFVSVGKKEKKLSYGNSFVIGIFQALAIIPGISRSGATISSGIFFGLSEKAAMRFAFLLSIPIIFGANILVIGNNVLPQELIWATLVSFFVGLLTIHIMFKYVLVKRKNFRWFGLYALLLALAIGVWMIIK